MKKKYLFLLSILSGIILSLGWTDWCPGYVIFVGLVPLLYIEKYISDNRLPSVKVYGFSALTFLIWNILTTWWLKNASFAGMLAAFAVNVFLYSGVFQLFHLFKKKTNSSTGYFGFIVFWIAFEYFYLNAEISWTWLNLGNAFANDIKSIQWYEYTGVLGGSLWILIINLLFFKLTVLIVNKIKGRILNTSLAILFSIIIIPVIISLIIFRNYTEKTNPYNVVAIQPNVDPYEKFVSLSNLEQTYDLIKIASMYVDSTTDYIICPESSITSYTEISALHYDKYIRIIKQFVSKYPRSKFIAGFFLRQTYAPGDKITPTAKQYPGTNYYYDSYNSAVQVDTSGMIPFYHKSQLVVGVEKMPYPKTLHFLKKIMVNLGGTFRSHGIQEERTNLCSSDSSVCIAPVICYENIFGEYVSEFVKKGAQIIFVITNEGWWGDTQSHRELNHLSRLRAIENRRSVVRSANTGTSSFINQKGEILQQLGWWKKGALKGIVNANSEITFYTHYGDYLGRVSVFFTFLCFLLWLVNTITNRKLINR